MRKIIRNTRYAIKPIWEINRWYVILNILYVFHNIPRRLLNILITKYIVDAACVGADFRKMLLYGIVFLSFEILLIVLKHCFEYIYKQPQEERIRIELKRRMMQTSMGFDLSCYDDAEFFNSYTKAFSALDKVAFTALNTLVKLLGAVISVLTIISYIFVVDPVIIVVSLIGSAISILSNSFISKIQYSEKEKQTLPVRKCSYAEGRFFDRNTAKDLRIEKLSEVLFASFQKAAEQKMEILVAHGKKKAVFKILFEAPLDVSDMFMWLYIAYGIVRGTFQAGDFMSLSNAVWSLSQQIRNVFNTIPDLYENALYTDDIIRFEEHVPKVTSGKEAVGQILKHTIEFQKVSFSYKEGQNILSSISFRISSGQRLAVVGQNGAGKSTFVKLLLRLYNPEAGEILLDGISYTSYQLKQLREQFAVVFQDYQYYAFTIAENLLMRLPENPAEEEVVIDALKKVGLYEKIRKFPKGIYTQLTQEFDKEGVVFSGGEYQKLAIARAIVKDAPILIMDEPSSALDPLMEKELSDLIDDHFRDKIVIIISHKLSMTKDSDCIVFLEQGRICEQGSHKELLERQGKYAKLWEVQSEKYLM